MTFQWVQVQSPDLTQVSIILIYQLHFIISSSSSGIESGSESIDVSLLDNSEPNSPKSLMPKSVTLPAKLDVKNVEMDELDKLLQVERIVDEGEKLYQTMPVPLPSQISTESSGDSSRWELFKVLVMLMISECFSLSESTNKLSSSTVTITEDSSTLKAPLDCSVTTDTSLTEDKIPLISCSNGTEETWTLMGNNLNRLVCFKAWNQIVN